MKVLSEKQFEKKIDIIYKQEQVKILNEKWEKLSKDEKLVIIEMFKMLNPDVKVPINEAKWYNTVMDWAGLIPGIGSAIDLVNGFSYWRQGDKLFAILSWIGALPVFGDLIAAPVIGVLKAGGRGAELFKGAVLAKDSVKVAEAAGQLGGPVAKMVETAPRWGTNLIEVLEKSVGKFPWLGKGLVNTVRGWVDIFVNAGKGANAFKAVGKPALRKLTQDTKFYLGLLDYLGMGNFTGGPEELLAKVPDLEIKMANYEKSLGMEPSGISEPSMASATSRIAPPEAPRKESSTDPIMTLASLFI